jgi:hypothetical protein
MGCALFAILMTNVGAIWGATGDKFAQDIQVTDKLH